VAVGVNDRDSAVLAAVRALADAAVWARLDAIGRRIEVLVAEGGPGTRASELRLGLSMLRRAAAENAGLVSDRLGRFERDVARAEHKLRAARRHAAEVANQRGLLAASRARAHKGGLVEHAGIAAAYRKAYEQLHADVVDLKAARSALEAYQDVVRRALAEGERG
jgi:serine protease Do